MTIQTIAKSHSAFWKTVVCVSLATFYIAMLAWPFGLSGEGYTVSRALLAGAIMFAISIPAWIINIKREFYSEETERGTNTVTEAEHAVPSIGQLAMDNRWLTPSEVRQVMFCQEADEKKFGEVAVKRNFLTLNQVKSLMAMQSDMKKSAMVNEHSDL